MVTTQFPIAVLWDSSHIWGLMVLRALRALGFPVQLLKGSEIAHGALFRKQGSPVTPACSLLIVPGGAAAPKSAALGEEGLQAIRTFVAMGGHYLGFCGGAGLALTHSKGLCLCPWKRASYPERILHLLSGYVVATPCPSTLTPAWEKAPVLPVWWPGRFENSGGNVDVLARYTAPARDFWIADIPVGSLPEQVLADWKTRYGVNFTADFLTGSELIVHGEYGKGDYLLSYSHLETPESPDANLWLRHLLTLLTDEPLPATDIPAWRPTQASGNSFALGNALGEAATRMRSLMTLAMKHRLFFRRTSWLTGWKQGLPGSVCNNLLTALAEAEQLEPTPPARAYWSGKDAEFSHLAEKFFPSAEGFFLAARLADTLLPTMPGVIDRPNLARERDRLFGHPMAGGGLLEKMQNILEEYIYLCLKRN